MEKEIWKDVVGYENLYQVSNLGRIKSKERLVNQRYGKRIVKEKILSPFISNSGYYAIVLHKTRPIFKLKYIHRLVANAFLPNKNNLEQVNHKDGNKLNNNISNLEWCSRSDNMKHAIKIGLFSQDIVNERIKQMNKIVRKPILQIKNGKIIAEYESTVLAGKQFTKNADRNISACARGLLPSAYGYQWKYKV